MLAALICGAPQGAVAAERDPVYTFIGPVIGAGMNRIVYADWKGLYREQTLSGYSVDSGFSFWVVSKWLIGDVALCYRYNNFNAEGELHHLYCTITGRVGIPLGSVAILAPGIGIYIETPPANKMFNGGAGLRVPLAFLFNTTFDTKLFIEGSFMYGWYGKGDSGEKMSYGVDLGFIFKVGRI